ncbi:MAG TPA: hypothetical protein VFL83_07815 [Anaeromyxobacter sp.]|nr:hypothetical protein [Anaeromyxobacter sp.]
MAAVHVLLAVAVLADPGRPPPDPCRAAAAPLPRPAELPRDAARAVDAYRAAWRGACEPKATPDVAALLGDAEVLAADARKSRAVRAIAAAAAERGGEWPLPGIRLVDGELAVDWGAFAPFGARGKVDDVRFWRGAAIAADGSGGPAWLEHAPDAPGGACVRLGTARWRDVVRALDDMEATRAAQYAGRARTLRDELVETLAGIGRGPVVCGCLRADPTTGLHALAALDAPEGPDAPAQPAVAEAARAALDAVQSGRVKVRWLRDAPGAEPTGCGAAP